ncbi:helix-turn-helix domain-containing protein [Rhodobacteraceae bacterium NNCM2]|nr:helix-turn-helix domain-containing protein [Coraliihabitans acroporae]
MFPTEGGSCKARDAALYLAHTGEGQSIRSLAEESGTHPSTVMRAVRRVEEKRDDPLIDKLLDDLGGVEIRKAAPRPLSDPSALLRDVKRFLRRLCEPGSFLLVAPGAEKGGIFCASNEHRKPIAMMPVATAVEFVKHDWIRITKRGTASIVYRVTEAGRQHLRRALAEGVQDQSTRGFADAQTPFQAQHRLEGERIFMDRDNGKPVTMKVNLAESPLGWLSRRRGADGQPFLSPDEVEAGERLCNDFEIANMGPQVAQDWRKFLTPGDKYAGTPRASDPGEGPMAARERVSKALSSLGMGLADIAFRVCCFHEGLEACERRMGWSARSGKVVLKIALQRLAEHYGIAMPKD